MYNEFLQHYENVEDQATQRLHQFENVERTEKALFEELAFCVFAANSSAKMAQKAVSLLKPILHTGDESQYKSAVKGKVRFYNVRSEYLAYNFEYVQKTSLRKMICVDKPRKELLNLKGIGMKEASHFLRNTGHSGYVILDKHIREIAYKLEILETASYESSYENYILKEAKIIEFCETNNLDIDVFDLAAWSYKTGKILK